MSKKASKATGGGTPATVALTRAGVHYTVWPYDHDPSTTHFGDEAVRALGQNPDRVFKTLLVSCEGGAGSLVCAVVPVSCSLDLKALASAAGAKRATMADPAEAERATGYLVGGISPLAHKRRIPIFMDASVLTWPTIFVSAGRRGLQVELAPADLVAVTGASVVDLARR